MLYTKEIVILFLILVLICLVACAQKHHPKTLEAIKTANEGSTNQVLTKGEKIIDQAIAAHGGKLYDKAHYSFIFRKKLYEFKNDDQLYNYKVTEEKSDTLIVSELNNYGFSKKIAGQPITLSNKDKSRYGNSLNSVIYFATLPYKLNDGAVNKRFVEETKIIDEDYYVIEVTFDEENGGVDHDDVFYYWINKSNMLIDYLAYNYSVNKGGVRFRTAENKRTVGGIVFQDYINYKAEIRTELSKLPELWEQGILNKLSEIRTEKVIQLSAQVAE